MIVRENASLAPLTTLGVGGAARFLIEARTEGDVLEALAFARERGLSVSVLGRGSNVLVTDAGVGGVVVQMLPGSIEVEESDGDVRIVADAGVHWDDVVDAACAHGVFGIANLAAIPGTLGGAAVQNIGAYGAEFSEAFEYADVIDPSGMKHRVMKSEAAFAYRTSFFKTHPEFIITRVALTLSKSARPNIAYADLARASASGVSLATPSEVASAVRAIRAEKFPYSSEEGTAGSFFKNPIITRELADSLATRFPGLPTYPQTDGTAKVSLAWLLDHALSLKGYAEGNVRLYEKQPIVLVARTGASANEVRAFADAIIRRVHDAIGVTIECEVESFGAK